MIKLPVFKKKSLCYNVGNNFVIILELEILFPNINEDINCKIFLWLHRLPPDLLAIFNTIAHLEFMPYIKLRLL